jgi:AcrR family transcriptional regulator
MAAQRAGGRFADKNPRRRQGLDKPLSRERIVSVALALVDEGGLKALSTRRLPAVLGLHPTAAYHDLPNKADLHDAIIEEVLVDVKVSGSGSSLCSLSRTVLVL